MPPLHKLTNNEKEELMDMMEARIRKLAKDGAFVSPLWEEGYDKISKKTMDGLSLWIGRKIVHMISAAILTSFVAWAIIYRGFK